jgi:hypothetical protein
LPEFGEICAAAEAAGINRACHYEWLETNPGYCKQFSELKANRVQRANDTAYRLGVIGVLVPKTVAQVRELVREHDTKVLIRWLEVHDPKWKPRTAINITNMDELAERLKAGRERAAKAKKSEPTE